VEEVERALVDKAQEVANSKPDEVKAYAATSETSNVAAQGDLLDTKRSPARRKEQIISLIATPAEVWGTCHVTVPIPRRTRLIRSQARSQSFSRKTENPREMREPKQKHQPRRLVARHANTMPTLLILIKQTENSQ